MNTYTTRDGREITWTGKNICICTKCDEVFNSPAAFDAHLAARKGGKGPHDHSWMPRNKAGRLVTSLREASE